MSSSQGDEENPISFTYDLNPPSKKKSLLKKNLISINLDLIFKKPASIKLPITSISTCKTCDTIISLFSRNNEIFNEWICDTCSTINKTIFKNHLNVFKKNDIEFIKDLMDSPRNCEDQEGIIVLCIDTSGSMAGPRIDSVKSACLKTVQFLFQNYPGYKLAVLTFDSVSRYYGNGDLNQHTITKKDWLAQNSHIINSIKNSANNLQTVSESYKTLNQLFINLDADGGTNLCGALAHSVIIASTNKNSFVLLCTDGSAADSDENFYNSIVNYAKNNNLIKIDIISFEEAECNLSMLGKVACETNSKITRTNVNDFEEKFLNIIEENLNNRFRLSVIDLVLIGNYDLIDIDNSGYKLNINCLNRNINEIQVEFDFKHIPKVTDYLTFQIQIKSTYSIRVITELLNLNQNPSCLIKNEHLVHLCSIKKISNLILDYKDILRAKEFTSEYENFLTTSHLTSDLSYNVISLVKKLPYKLYHTDLNDQDSELLYNSKNLYSKDFLKSLIINNNNTNNDKINNNNSNSYNYKNQIVPNINKENFQYNKTFSLNYELKTDLKTKLKNFYSIVTNIDNSKSENKNGLLKNDAYYSEARRNSLTQKHSLKMIMISLKMIKEAAGICLRAKKFLKLSASSNLAMDSTYSKSDKFLNSIFENITLIEKMLKTLTNGSNILGQKDNEFLNKLFDELKDYLDSDIYAAIKSPQ